MASLSSSLISIRRQTGDGVVSLFSRATRYTFSGECTAASKISPARHFGTRSKPNANRLRATQYTYAYTRAKVSPLQRLPAQQLTTVRFNSDESSKPSFRQWGFEDINASLPSDSRSSPSSTPRIILIDVREPAELNTTGIIPSAVAMPLASQPDALFLTPDEFETRFGYPKPGVEEPASANGGEKKADIIFYCKAGVRARAAAQLAVQAGYEADRIGVYEGSWLDWRRNGGRKERWEGDD
ncbi:Rhodanese-like domain-containing protein [Aspergillus californicus]